MFNVFKSAIAYDTSIKTLPNIAKEGGEEHMVEYEFEPDTKEEVMQVRRHYYFEGGKTAQPCVASFRTWTRIIVGVNVVWGNLCCSAK